MDADFELSKVYESFPIVLNERISSQRKLYRNNLSPLTAYLVRCIAYTNDVSYLQELLSESINTILLDCELYYNMSKQKALDAIIELDSLASVYASEQSERYSLVYKRIKKLSEQLLRTYSGQ